MKLMKVNEESDERCETCRYFVQHYVKVPFINMDLVEAKDGYCVQARSKNVKVDQRCEKYRPYQEMYKMRME